MSRTRMARARVVSPSSAREKAAFSIASGALFPLGYRLYTASKSRTAAVKFRLA